jgi:hypothetical protein
MVSNSNFTMVYKPIYGPHIVGTCSLNTKKPLGFDNWFTIIITLVYGYILLVFMDITMYYTIGIITMDITIVFHGLIN